MKPDNPQAFPKTYTHDAGMTLRDYFAGQALAGIMCQGWIPNGVNRSASAAAYELADAMLEERSKEKR